MKIIGSLALLFGWTLLDASNVMAQTPCTIYTPAIAPAGSSAATIAQTLNGAFKIAVKPIGSTAFLVCSEAAGVVPIATSALDRLIGEAVADAAKPKDPKKGRSESPQVRLFFHRDAAAVSLASALDKTVAGIGVSAAGPDLLVFKPTDSSDDESLRQLKRVVALIDAPKPEITLNAWSVRASSSRQEDVDRTARSVRNTIYQYNEELRPRFSEGGVT
jgi:hypothetical protein